MVNLILPVVLIILIWLFFKSKNMQHKIYTIGLILLVIFFYATGSKVISDNKVDLGSFDGVVSAGKLYFSWLGQLFENVATIAGNAIKMSWAGNSTIK